MTLQTAKQPALQPDRLAAGMRAFFKIGEKWQLTNEQEMTLLGMPSRSAYFNWKNGSQPAQSLDLATRISYVLGIFKALQLLYQQPTVADDWAKRPNAAFGGQSALDRMLAGQITDLAAVRGYLDSVRGGW